MYWCVVKKLIELHFEKKKCLYSTYSSFLVINVCNQGKTLCSPCIIRRKRIACRTTKAEDSHSEYVIHIAFPLQQGLHEHASKLHVYSMSCWMLNWCYSNHVATNSPLSQENTAITQYLSRGHVYWRPWGPRFSLTSCSITSLNTVARYGAARASYASQTSRRTTVGMTKRIGVAGRSIKELNTWSSSARAVTHNAVSLYV